MATAVAKSSRTRRTPPPLLRPYGRRDHNSGVTAYAAGDDCIFVQFKSGEIYLYTNKSAGHEHIEAMKRCAAAGEGLSAYISRHAHENYAAKLGRDDLPHPPGRQAGEAPPTSVASRKKQKRP